MTRIHLDGYGEIERSEGGQEVEISDFRRMLVTTPVGVGFDFVQEVCRAGGIDPELWRLTDAFRCGQGDPWKEWHFVKKEVKGEVYGQPGGDRR